MRWIPRGQRRWYERRMGNNWTRTLDGSGVKKQSKGGKMVMKDSEMPNENLPISVEVSEKYMHVHFKRNFNGATL